MEAYLQHVQWNINEGIRKNIPFNYVLIRVDDYDLSGHFPAAAPRTREDYDKLRKTVAAEINKIWRCSVNYNGSGIWLMVHYR